MFISITLSKIYLDLRNPIKCISLLKYSKRLSDFCKNFTYKRKCYKWLSFAFLMIRKYEKAQSFIYKYMQLSWITENVKNEILSYDLLGLVFFYLGEISKA
jgi:hypothetical protein